MGPGPEGHSTQHPLRPALSSSAASCPPRAHPLPSPSRAHTTSQSVNIPGQQGRGCFKSPPPGGSRRMRTGGREEGGGETRGGEGSGGKRRRQQRPGPRPQAGQRACGRCPGSCRPLPVRLGPRRRGTTRFLLGEKPPGPRRQGGPRETPQQAVPAAGSPHGREILAISLPPHGDPRASRETSALTRRSACPHVCRGCHSARAARPRSP